MTVLYIDDCLIHSGGEPARAVGSAGPRGSPPEGASYPVPPWALRVGSNRLFLSP